MAVLISARWSQPPTLSSGLPQVCGFTCLSSRGQLEVVFPEDGGIDISQVEPAANIVKRFATGTGMWVYMLIVTRSARTVFPEDGGINIIQVEPAANIGKRFATGMLFFF
jgi:hypothetical protein